jgi:hypothetical protein
MFTHTAAPWRAAALLSAMLAAMPAVAQHTADNPAAGVPETRYQSAHVQRPPVAAATTPDRNWQESNRIVAGQPAHAHAATHATHADHAGHSAHAGHAKPAQKEQPKADHQGHHGHHGHGEHH